MYPPRTPSSSWRSCLARPPGSQWWWTRTSSGTSSSNWTASRLCSLFPGKERRDFSRRFKNIFLIFFDEFMARMFYKGVYLLQKGWEIVVERDSSVVFYYYMKNIKKRLYKTHIYWGYFNTIICMKPPRQLQCQSYFLKHIYLHLIPWFSN